MFQPEGKGQPAMAEGHGESTNVCNTLMEVLSRLPGKSLMRFKCVSKHWFSLITHPSFVDMYQQSPRRRGALFVIAPRNHSTYPHCWDHRFFIVDWKKKNQKDRATIHDPSSIPFTTNRVTNIVNGLICFYHNDGNEGSISVYNLTTREHLPLPAPMCAPVIQRRCYLGFDPINKEYKLIHTYWQVKTLDPWVGVGCEVFNITGKDHKTWRTIDVSHMDTIAIIYSDDVGFCHDGIIYWRRKDGILAFHVERENIEHINNPPGGMPQECSISLCQVGGYLSLVAIPPRPRRYAQRPYTVEIIVTMWRLMGRNQYDGSPLWMPKVFTCPFENIIEGRVKCTDFGLVTLATIRSNATLVTIDCYDLNTGKYMMLKINNAQGFLSRYSASHNFTPPFGFGPTLLVENVMPLKSNNIEAREDMC